MKSVYTAIVLTSVLSSFAFSEEVPKYRLNIEKITPEVQETPQFKVDGPKEKKVKPRDWMEIEVEIDVKVAPEVVDNSSGLMPELEAHWYAVVKDKYERDPKKNSVRLHGSVKYKNIRTEDKTIILSAYIDPDTLKHLTGKDRLNERDVEGFAVVVSGPGVAVGEKYAKGLEAATAKEADRWWVKWDGRVLEDAIIPKGKTPFAMLWTDRYPREVEEK